MSSLDMSEEKLFKLLRQRNTWWFCNCHKYLINSSHNLETLKNCNDRILLGDLKIRNKIYQKTFRNIINQIIKEREYSLCPKSISQFSGIIQP